MAAASGGRPARATAIRGRISFIGESWAAGDIGGLYALAVDKAHGLAVVGHEADVGHRPVARIPDLARLPPLRGDVFPADGADRLLGHPRRRYDPARSCRGDRFDRYVAKIDVAPLRGFHRRGEDAPVGGEVLHPRRDPCEAERWV